MSPLTDTNLQVERSAAALEARVERRKEGSGGRPQARDGVRNGAARRDKASSKGNTQEHLAQPSSERERVEHKTVTFTGHPGVPVR